MSNIIRLDNRLIQQPGFGNFNFKLREWRVLMQLLARVRQGDTHDTVYNVQMRELCGWLGLDIENRRATVTDIKKVMKSISDESTYIKPITGKEDNVRAIVDTSVIYAKNNILVTYYISRNFAQFLVNMSEFESNADKIPSYTCAEPDMFNSLKTALACKLYLFFKSYRTIPGHKINLDENRIRQLVFGDKNKKGYHTGKILSMVQDALDDISEHTDIKIEMDKRQNGRTLQGCQFSIGENKPEIIGAGSKRIPPRRDKLKRELIAYRIEHTETLEDMRRLKKCFKPYQIKMAVAYLIRHEQAETPEKVGKSRILTI